MKSLLAFAAAVFTFSANAAVFPELYCVSVRTFENVNQINVFTNNKGTMRISAQYYAVSEDGGDSGLFDTGMLQTIRSLDFDSRTGMMSNGANKVQFQLTKEEFTPEQAERELNVDPNKHFDIENMGGHKVAFTKFYRGVMVEYNLPGRKGYWSGSLRDAFKRGVTQYICGNAKDAKSEK